MAAALAPLAGCAGGSSSADIAPTAAPPPVDPRAASLGPAAAALSAARTGRPLEASRTGGGAASPPAQQAALTPEEVKAQCWMKFENDKRAKNIDARLQLVDKCIAETSRGQPPAR